MNELVTMLDRTLGIWQNNQGYYWFDQFDRQRSGYFKTESQAIDDCQDLIME